MKKLKFVQLVSFLIVIAVAIPAVHSQQDRRTQPGSGGPGGPGGGFRPGGDQQGRPQQGGPSQFGGGGGRGGPPGAVPQGGQFGGGGGRGAPPGAVPQIATPQQGGRGGPGVGPGAGGPFGGGAPVAVQQGGAPGAGNNNAGVGNNANRNLQIVNALKGMDTNNDGRLDPSEIPEARRPFVQMMAQRLGVNPNGPIDLRALERSMAVSTPASSSGTRSRSIVLPENPLVPYFGEVSMAISTGTTVLAFGQRERTIAPTPMYDSQNPRGGRGQQVQNADLQLQQTIKAARDLLTRNDKNRNGTLDRLNDEWNGLPFDANAADKNKDGRLTLSEIITALGGRPGANLGAAKATTVSGSYQDRMPEGVPDWFTRMDTNKDGQITLFEYAEGKPFTDEMINEFKANDVNGDGIITIEEAYAFMKRMDDEKRKKDAEAAEQAGNDPTSRPPQRNTNPRQPGASNQPNRPQSQSTTSPSAQPGNRGGNNPNNQRPQRPDQQGAGAGRPQGGFSGGADTGGGSGGGPGGGRRGSGGTGGGGRGN